MKVIKKQKDLYIFAAKRIILLIILIFLFILLIISVVRIYKKHQLTKVLVKEAENRLQTIKEKSLQLEQDIRKLETPRGIEEELRNRYRIAKPGEQVIILLENQSE